MWVGRKLTPAEVNYCTREQELLGILYTVERCRRYLHGRRFIAHTDAKSLLWLYNNQLEGRVARWAMKLGAYDIELRHIKGKHNIVADSLTRMDYPQSVAAALAVWIADPKSDKEIRDCDSGNETEGI